MSGGRFGNGISPKEFIITRQERDMPPELACMNYKKKVNVKLQK